MNDKQTELASMIGGFVETWIAVQSLDCMLAKEKEVPALGPEWYGIMWGAADSFGQSIGADLPTTAGAVLQHFLLAYSDGDALAAKICAASRHAPLQPWVTEAGHAVYDMRHGIKRPEQALLPLAEKYRNVQNARKPAAPSSGGVMSAIARLWGAP